MMKISEKKCSFTDLTITPKGEGVTEHFSKKAVLQITQ
jgi:hypothetical protein